MRGVGVHWVGDTMSAEGAGACWWHTMNAKRGSTTKWSECNPGACLHCTPRTVLALSFGGGTVQDLGCAPVVDVPKQHLQRIIQDTRGP